MLFGRLLCLLAIVFFANPARLSAATISVLPFDKPSEAMILVEGELVYGDAAQFRSKVSPISKAIVVLKSDGGNLAAGIEIGRIIRFRNFATWVPSGVRCASACSAIWLGGAPRLMGKNALIGFHAAYRPTDGRESGAANAVLGGYLRDLGLSDVAIIYITATAPTSMTWLALSDANQLGIDVTTFDPENRSTNQSATTTPSSTPSPQPRQNVASQLQSRSLEFVTALYRVTSGPDDELFLALNKVYAETVRYYGKELSRDQLIGQLQKFVARWPVRKYVPRSDTISVVCDEVALSCEIRGNVQFDAQSIDRNERSTGLATFEYTLSFRAPGQAPKITAESGVVLERNKRALSSDTGSFLWDRSD